MSAYFLDSVQIYRSIFTEKWVNCAHFWSNLPDGWPSFNKQTHPEYKDTTMRHKILLLAVEILLLYGHNTICVNLECSTSQSCSYLSPNNRYYQFLHSKQKKTLPGFYYKSIIQVEIYIFHLLRILFVCKKWGVIFAHKRAQKPRNPGPFN